MARDTDAGGYLLVGYHPRRVYISNILSTASAIILESIDKRRKVSMLRRVARAGDGGAAARGAARAACGLESWAWANRAVEVLGAKPAQTA